MRSATALVLVVLLGPACASYCESPRALQAYVAQARKTDLLACLDSDQSWVREETARALGGLRSRDAVERLQAILLDNAERPWVRAAAADGLARLARPETFDAMAGVLADTGLDPEPKLALIAALCAFPDRRDDAVQAITPLIGDEDLIVAAFAEKEVRSRCAP